jgi:hypothetical protein
MPRNTRSQSTSAFQTILSVIHFILLGFHEPPLNIHWEYPNPIWRIQDTLLYLNDKKEYHDRQELNIYYNLSMDLYMATRHYTQNFYQGPLKGNETISGSLLRDMQEYAEKYCKMSKYNAIVAIRLFHLFWGQEHIFSQIRGISIKHIHDLKDQELPILANVMGISPPGIEVPQGYSHATVQQATWDNRELSWDYPRNSFSENSQPSPGPPSDEHGATPYTSTDKYENDYSDSGYQDY